ncbi:MAG: hypothetical protein ACXQTP_06040 [Candidatus Methanofastidiosia archaeon]
MESSSVLIAIDKLEKLIQKITGRGWHLPAFWALGLGMFPFARFLFEKDTKGPKKKIFHVCGIFLVLFGVFLMFVLRLYVVFCALCLAGRIGYSIKRAFELYEPGTCPEGNIFRIIPSIFYLIQMAFIKLYGNYFKIPFFFVTLGFGPAALALWRKGKSEKILSIFISIIGLFLFMAVGYKFTILAVVAGVLFLVIGYVLKKVGLEEKIFVLEREVNPSWDKAAIVFIVFIFATFLINVSKFSPNVIDLWYHLAVSRKILELGTIPLWDFWEFAPAGRPHLYPPFFHLIIAAIARTPENVVDAGRYMQALIYPSALATTWYMARKFFGSKIAALSVFFLSIDMGFLLVSTMALPSALINAMLPLLIISFIYKKNPAVYCADDGHPLHTHFFSFCNTSMFFACNS